MTFSVFLVVFLVAPIGLLIALQRQRGATVATVAGVAAALELALYFVPLNLLAGRSVLIYPSNRVGAFLWNVPIEVYLSLALQGAFVALVTTVALGRPWGRE